MTKIFENVGVLKPEIKFVSISNIEVWPIIFRKKIIVSLTAVGWHFVGSQSPLKELIAKICESLKIRITKSVRIIQ